MSAGQAPATYVSDLRPNRIASLEAEIKDLEPPRDVAVANGVLKKVQNARIQDRTGEVVLVLWGEEGRGLSVGDRIRISEGWVKDYKGRLQISLGRTGKLVRLEPPAPTPGVAPRKPSKKPLS